MRSLRTDEGGNTWTTYSITTPLMAKGISQNTREKIVKQALLEVAFARMPKNKLINKWKENEQLAYQEKPKGAESRANVDLGRGPEFINTYLSKIKSGFTFEFDKKKNSQSKRVRRLNALKDQDYDNGFWHMKAVAAKKQMGIYGRGVCSFYADSIDGVYRAHLENIDAYDFLIDPAAGGLDVENARFLGDKTIVYDRYELEIKKDDDGYISSEIKQLLKGGGNNTVKSIEDTSKDNRSMITVGRSDREMYSPDKFRFWRWGTTFEGERYYLVFEETSGRCIRICKLTDLFPATYDFPLGPWWYITFANTIDQTEFWTAAPIEQPKDIFFAQNVSINQVLDNGEEYNKPMKIVNVAAIENLAELKYRREGIIKTKNNFNADNAVQVLRPNSNQVPLLTFDKLEIVQEKASGVTADAKGASGEDRVAIYQGNQQNSADRFTYVNMSFDFARRRLARLYELGVMNHLNKKQTVDIIGPDGIEQEEITKRDIFRKDESFKVVVRSSDVEEQNSILRAQRKTDFLLANQKMMNPVQNAQKAYEIGAKVAGFTDQEVRALLDTSSYADADVIAEAERDLEDMLDGKTVRPNLIANNAYKQCFVDFMRDHTEDINAEQFTVLTQYIDAIGQIVMKNEAADLQKKKSKMLLAQADAMSGQAPQPQPQGMQTAAPMG